MVRLPTLFVFIVFFFTTVEQTIFGIGKVLDIFLATFFSLSWTLHGTGFAERPDLAPPFRDPSARRVQ